MMKKILFPLLIIALFSTPVFVGAFSISTNPPSHGIYIGDPLQVSVSFDSLDDLGSHSGSPAGQREAIKFWGIALNFYNRDTESFEEIDVDNCFPSTSLSETVNFGFSNEGSVDSVKLYTATSTNPADCFVGNQAGEQNGGWIGFVLERYWEIFRKNTWGNVSTNLSSNLLAMISAAFADQGLLLIIALAAGLPLAFWAIKRVIGLIGVNWTDKWQSEMETKEMMGEFEKKKGIKKTTTV